MNQLHLQENLTNRNGSPFFSCPGCRFPASLFGPRCSLQQFLEAGPPDEKGKNMFIVKIGVFNGDTVDGWNPAPLGSLPHYLQGFIHPRWCRISSINRMNRVTQIFAEGYVDYVASSNYQFSAKTFVSFHRVNTLQETSPYHTLES